MATMHLSRPLVGSSRLPQIDIWTLSVFPYDYKTASTLWRSLITRLLFLYRSQEAVVGRNFKKIWLGNYLYLNNNDFFRESEVQYHRIMSVTSDFGSKIMVLLISDFRNLNRYLNSYFYSTVEHSDDLVIFLFTESDYEHLHCVICEKVQPWP
jgi:hypothetical protein